MLKNLFPKSVSPAVRAEQIRLLYHQGTTILLLGIFTGIIAVIMFWKVVDHTMLVLWLSIHSVVSLIRLIVAQQFLKRDVVEHRALENWGRAYVVGTFISGLIWGSLCMFFNPAWPVQYQIILFAIYTGITAGALNTNSSLFIAFPAFYLPPVVWLTYVMQRQSGEGFFELEALFMIYIILMYISSLKFHNKLAETLEVRFENERLACDLAQSNQRLECLADTDALTNLFNRRSMDRYLKNEWNRHLRAHKPLSLIFLDIDCFKQYNDTYGHDGGDQCLIQVAKVLLNNSLRSSDMVTRFGGEEFAVILPETTEDDAYRIAEAICSELGKKRIPHAGSIVVNYVTISVGVATMIPRKADSEELLRLSADKALYKAKVMGRNQIIKADSEPVADLSIA